MNKKSRVNVLVKEFFRELKDSVSRFVSIIIIVALGSGFFAGIKASSLDMVLTSDQFLKDVNFMDASVTSNYGLSENDVDSLKKIPGVSKVTAEYQMDFLVSSDSSIVLRTHSYDEGESDSINKFQLVSGRLPENPGECLVEDLRGKFYDDHADTVGLGSVITLSTGTKDEMFKYLKNETYTVVGTITSPLYISLTRGASLIGTGTVDYFMYLPSTEFDMDAYVYSYITFDSSKELTKTFSKEYTDVLLKENEKIDAVSSLREEERLEEIKKEPLEKIADAEQTLEKERKKGEKELMDAKAEIDDGKSKITSGEKELLDATKTFNDEISKAEKEIESSRAKLNSGQADYELGLKEFEKSKMVFDSEKALATAKFAKAEDEIIAGESQLSQSKQQLDATKVQLDAGYLQWKKLDAAAQQSGDAGLIAEAAALKAQLDGGKAEYDVGLREYQGGLEYINAAKLELEAGKNELAAAENLLINAKQKFDTAKAEIDLGWAQLSSGIGTLESKKSEGKGELAKAESELAAARLELAEGQKKYDDGLAEFEEEIGKAENEISDALAEVEKLETAEWTITLRQNFADVSEFNDNANRIDNISRVFPVFFLLIAALVCLTTMTRMVDSQRSQIGTLKALGYSVTAIAAKYVMYAFLASFIGSLLGVALGYQVFPRIIYGAYTSLLFRLPPVNAAFHFELSGLVIGVSVAAIMSVTVFTCYRSLKTMPSQLLRPPAPKSGKRIWLEKITPVWNLFNFSWKVTLRNIFRYKKRMFMTLVGIAGCTGLMLAGFGLRDSISGIVDMQFDKVMKYDVGAIIDTDIKDYELILDEVKETAGVEDAMLNAYAGGKAQNGSKKIDFSFIVTKDEKHLSDFINFEERKSGAHLELDAEGTIITEKLAKLLGVSSGDTIEIERDGKIVDAKVVGVMENYAFHYVYMQESYFESLFNEILPSNQIMISLDKETAESSTAITDISKKIMDIDGVYTVTSTNDMSGGLSDQMGSLNTVIFVLVFCAAILAFIVMYNLTNINILEREREVATIKVLGFYDNETSSYIYRESALLSILGTLLGFVVGVILTRFVVMSAEVDQMMFGQEIHLLSYVYAFALTLLFTFIVKIFIDKRIKSINMIEALKSVE